MIKGKISKTVGMFYLLILSGILMVIIGCVNMPNIIDSGEMDCKEFNAKWYQVLSDGEKIIAEVPGKCVAESGELIITETIVPDYVEDGKFLCFRSSQQDMQLYIDGELRGEYTTKDVRLFGKTSASAYVFVPIYSDDAGKTLRVETTSFSNYNGIMNKVYYGERFDIWKTFIAQYGMELAIALFMLVLAVISIVTSVVIKLCHKKEIVLEYLGWGILLVAIWIITESKLRQLFFENISLVSCINILALMLLPLPFAMYLNKIQKFRYKKLYNVIDTLIILDFVVCSALQFLNIVDFAQTMIVMHIVLIISVLAGVVTVLMDTKKGYDSSYRLIIIGLAILMIAGIVVVIRFYINDGQINAFGICVSLILLLIMTVIKTGQDIVDLERERQKVMFDNENQTGFLLKMSHEIRTPINTLIGMNEIIARENQNEEIAQYVFNAQQAGKTLLALVNDVLDFSKIESGTLNLTENVYQLASFVNDEVHMLQARADKKGLEVIINVDEKLPSYLYGDEVRIKQIVSTLLSNAVNQTEQGSVTFSVGGYTSDEGQFFIKVSIADTGVGFQEKDINNIFKTLDELNELDENPSQSVIDCGLDITKKLVDEVQGTIKVRSLYGKGSLFTVTIPQKVIDEAPIGMIVDRFAEEKRQVGKYKTSFIAPKARVLSVDDNEMNLSVVKGLLKYTQIQLDTVLSPQECLELCKINKYDLIFMDHMMPKIDGIQTMKMIHSQSDGCNTDTPIVVLTANAMAGIREKYMQDGFAEYISKPIVPEKLERVLNQFIPEDKIILVEDTEEIEEVSFSRKEVASVPLEAEIDKNIGLSYCGGDEELYEEMLKTYYEQGKEYAEKLPVLFENMDWGNYSTIAHAMKSTSLSIGAAKFSEMAKQHEMAGKEENASFIKDNWNDFYDNFINVLNTIAKNHKLDEEKTQTESVTEVSSESYRKECEILLEYLKNYEMNPAMEQLNKIATIKTSKIDMEKQTKLLDDMKNAIDDFDFGNAEEMLLEWTKEV